MRFRLQSTAFTLQAIQRLAYGAASSLLGGIGSPHPSQMPYSPLSNRASVFSIWAISARIEPSRATSASSFSRSTACSSKSASSGLSASRVILSRRPLISAYRSVSFCRTAGWAFIIASINTKIPASSNRRSPDDRFLKRRLASGISRYGQNRAGRISDYSLGRATAKRIQKTMMPPGSHHDEIGAAFMRRLKNLSLDRPLFGGLSPLPGLTLRHDDFREAVFTADVDQREDYAVTFERTGE